MSAPGVAVLRVRWVLKGTELRSATKEPRPPRRPQQFSAGAAPRDRTAGRRV